MRQTLLCKTSPIIWKLPYLPFYFGSYYLVLQILITRIVRKCNMAEILGTASAIVGLAAFVTQVVEKIDALKTAYRYNQTEAPILIESLIENLETFHLILQFTRSLEGHPAVDQVVVKCQTTYKSIDLSLEDLLKRASCMSSAKRVGLKSVMRRFSRDIHREVEEIKSKLDFMISILSL